MSSMPSAMAILCRLCMCVQENAALGLVALPQVVFVIGGAGVSSCMSTGFAQEHARFIVRLLREVADSTVLGQALLIILIVFINGLEILPRHFRLAAGSAAVVPSCWCYGFRRAKRVESVITTTLEEGVMTGIKNAAGAIFALGIPIEHA